MTLSASSTMMDLRWETSKLSGSRAIISSILVGVEMTI